MQDQKLLELLQEMHNFQSLLYWRNSTHCGSDYSPECLTINTCPHAKICDQAHKIEILISKARSCI
jgi:hypothetical protein